MPKAAMIFNRLQDSLSLACTFCLLININYVSKCERSNEVYNNLHDAMKIIYIKSKARPNTEQERKRIILLSGAQCNPLQIGGDCDVYNYFETQWIKSKGL